MSARRRIRHRRVVVIALTLAWLPYVAFRCVPGDHSAEIACDLLAHVSEAQKQHHVGPSRHAEAGHDHDGPAQTCCELTGKTSVTLVASASIEAQMVAVPLVPGSQALAPEPTIDTRGGVCRAHAPPIYLRNTALRI
jgi:hypothetical protein